MNAIHTSAQAGTEAPMAEFQLTELEARLEMATMSGIAHCCECIFNTCANDPI
jgi:hypothetical protein